MLPRRLEDGLAAKRGRIGRNRRRGAVSIVAIAAIATGVLFAAPGASAAKPGGTLTTFDTPGPDTWPVPHGVRQATSECFGAQEGRGRWWRRRHDVGRRRRRRRRQRLHRSVCRLRHDAGRRPERRWIGRDLEGLTTRCLAPTA